MYRKKKLSFSRIRVTDKVSYYELPLRIIQEGYYVDAVIRQDARRTGNSFSTILLLNLCLLILSIIANIVSCTGQSTIHYSFRLLLDSLPVQWHHVTS